MYDIITFHLVNRDLELDSADNFTFVLEVI